MGQHWKMSDVKEKRIVVLMGGLSKEREVSLVTGRECAAALREWGFKHVVEIDISDNLQQDIAKSGADICFNALHGPLGEDGSIQGLLNVLRIPYTHSGVLASSIAMHKQHTKLVAQAAGIRCPRGTRMSKEAFFARQFDHAFVVKPINEGSSVHTYVVRDPSNLPFPEDAWPYREPPLVEEFVAGIELTVTVLGGKSLTVTEIIPSANFYDYHAKYAVGGSRHVLPAHVPNEIFTRCLVWAETIHAQLECRGISRSDFIFDAARGSEGLYFLEINTQPGMTPTSLAPEQAKFCGISFPELVTKLVLCAATDFG
jgi:D-alanine-D-alanine ligase